MPLLRRAFALFLMKLLGTAWPAHAGVANAPGANLRVTMITYGPGETYWERFGHIAIELRDSQNGEAISFNYGVFDFDEKGFLLNNTGPDRLRFAPPLTVTEAEIASLAEAWAGILDVEGAA